MYISIRTSQSLQKAPNFRILQFKENTICILIIVSFPQHLTHIWVDQKFSCLRDFCCCCSLWLHKSQISLPHNIRLIAFDDIINYYFLHQLKKYIISFYFITLSFLYYFFHRGKNIVALITIHVSFLLLEYRMWGIDYSAENVNRLGMLDLVLASYDLSTPVDIAILKPVALRNTNNIIKCF